MNSFRCLAVYACIALSITPVLSAPVSFRVMTYNIHHGEGLDKKVDLDRIATLIRDVGADIVALEEVDKGLERTQRRDLSAELGKLTGLTCVFSNNYAFAGGEYGNAVLTRFPVLAAGNLHYAKVNETEQRGLLHLKLKVQNHELLFLATHLDHRHPDDARWSNAGEIEHFLAQHAQGPVILCGDFNDLPTSRLHERLAKSFDDVWIKAGKGDGFTIPAERPNRRIDYIWLSRNSPIQPVKAWVPESQSLASDHRPLVAEFEWKE